MLLRHYGIRCAVTGPAPAEVLDAAHLRPFAKHPSHHLHEGLLLRTDLHRLFDCGLLSVDPADHCVRIAPTLLNDPVYGPLHGTRLVEEAVTTVSVAALADHHSAALAT